MICHYNIASEKPVVIQENIKRNASIQSDLEERKERKQIISETLRMGTSIPPKTNLFEHTPNVITKKTTIQNDTIKKHPVIDPPYFSKKHHIQQMVFSEDAIQKRCHPETDSPCPDITMVTQLT